MIRDQEKTMKTKKFLLSMFSILLLATAGCSSSQNYITYDNGADITDIQAMEQGRSADK